LAIALAAAAFGLAALVFKVPRRGWTTLGAAFMLGLAGYALQARPDLTGAPAKGAQSDSQLGSALVEARQAMVGEDERSRSGKLLTADAFARRGRYIEAAALLRGAVQDNPRDADAWLALGNALVEHAGGALTGPALLAYKRAEQASPGSVGPGYFLGLALIRQGRMDEARQAWSSTLAAARPDAVGRVQLETLLARLSEALAAQAVPPADTAR
jgi:cytochrome c-type biogenesis protein CcmH